MLGEVGGDRFAPDRRSQRRALAFDRLRELLEVARRAHHPGDVAEMVAQLAEHGRDGVAGEREPALRLPAVDGLDQPDVGDLDQIVHGLVGVPEAQREGAREREIAFDQQFAGAPVTGAMQAGQPAIVAGSGARGMGSSCIDSGALQPVFNK